LQPLLIEAALTLAKPVRLKGPYSKAWAAVAAPRPSTHSATGSARGQCVATVRPAGRVESRGRKISCCIGQATLGWMIALKALSQNTVDGAARQRVALRVYPRACCAGLIGGPGAALQFVGNALATIRVNAESRNESAFTNNGSRRPFLRERGKR
jgi:hypothetical protein